MNLNQIKDFINQTILNLLPIEWHDFITPLLPHHWQEWVLPAMGVPLLLVFLLECLYRKMKDSSADLRIKRAFTNFNLGTTYIISDLLLQVLVVLPVCFWLYQYRLFTIEVNWFTAIPIFCAVEFCYYWFHRASHRINWFWSAHVVHHSDDGMNLSTAIRQSLLYSVVGWWLFFTPVMLLGVSPEWIFFFYAVNLLFQFFIHTETVDKFAPWIEYIFNTPSNHRAHHGTNDEYIDKNYGGVLMIFDHLFGTYVKEDRVNNPVRYGAIGEEVTENLIVIIFGVFFKMWKDVFATKGIINKLKVLFSPP